MNSAAISSLTATTSHAVASDNASDLPVTTNPAKSLGVDEFLKLIATQLTAQNPLEPMKDTDFMAQMASFTSLEQMRTLSTDFAAYSNNQRLVAAQDYLGKDVSVLGPNGLVNGRVTEVTTDGVTPAIVINNVAYDAANVVSVRATTPTITPAENPPTTVPSTL